MFEQAETNKLSTVTQEILSQINELGAGLSKYRSEVLTARKEMWREARIVIRDFDDVADLSIFAEEVARNENQYTEASKHILKLKKMLNEPYFARIDFIEDGYDEVEQIYIGRYSLFDEDTKTFHIYDWRAPISSLYYDYGVGEASFVVPGTGATIAGYITLKRQYQIEKGELLYLFDNDIAIDDEILRRELSKSADAHIKTIVNTIQTEQNKAIRAAAHNVLVHGPAGSGKTSVGLHRLAYLLYRDRNSLTSAKVRIFAPSPIFASYIAGIIPELGEEDVQNLDFPALMKDMGKDHRSFHGAYQQIEYMVAHPPNDERSMWLTHKYAPQFLDEVEAYVANYTPSFEDVMFNTDKLCSRARLEELYQDRTISSTLKSKTDRVISYVERTYSDYFKVKFNAITELFNNIHGENFSDHEIRVKYEEEKSIVIRDLKNRLRPRSSKLYGRFLKSYAYKTGLSHQFARQALDMDKLYYEDALMLFYIDILTGQVAQDKTVKHILLDEAQDLSHLHHRILNRLYVSSNFTILADANQALYKGINLDSIDELKALYPTAQDIPLSKSYRSTYEINTFAAQFLQTPNPDASYTRHGDEPQIVQTANPIAAVLDILPQQAEYNTVGILLPTAGEAVKFHALLKELYPKNNRPPLRLIASEDDDFAPGVMVMAVPFAKGLEFDVVICPGYGSTSFDGELGNRLMYLICTRALHRLYLFKEQCMINDYTKQAIVWDWDAYDDTPEYEYWCNYATQFGKNVLIPMCAHGQTGAHMAKKGFHVTAFDITPEMIAEGKKRYGDISSLNLVVGDICDLRLPKKDFDFTFISGNGDLHLLPSVKEVETAFLQMSKHIRPGGCFALELTLPSAESWSSPKRIFHPRVPNYTDKKVWKENESSYNADTKQHFINQTVYIQDANSIESFTQQVCLRYYKREEILELLRKCGFTITGEYCNRNKEPWKPGDTSWILETIKE